MLDDEYLFGKMIIYFSNKKLNVADIFLEASFENVTQYYVFFFNFNGTGT